MSRFAVGSTSEILRTIASRTLFCVQKLSDNIYARLSLYFFVVFGFHLGLEVLAEALQVNTKQTICIKSRYHKSVSFRILYLNQPLDLSRSPVAHIFQNFKKYTISCEYMILSYLYILYFIPPTNINIFMIYMRNCALLQLN